MSKNEFTKKEKKELKELRKKTMKVLRKLCPDDEESIKKAVGYFDDSVHALEEIGRSFKETQKRIRRN